MRNTPVMRTRVGNGVPARIKVESVTGLRDLSEMESAEAVFAVATSKARTRQPVGEEAFEGAALLTKTMTKAPDEFGTLILTLEPADTAALGVGEFLAQPSITINGLKEALHPFILEIEEAIT